MQWLLAVLVAGVAAGIQAAEVCWGGSLGAVPLWPACAMACAAAAPLWLDGGRRHPWPWLVLVGFFVGFGAHVGTSVTGARLPTTWGVWSDEDVVVVGEVREGSRVRHQGGATVVVEAWRCQRRSCGGRLYVTVPQGAPSLVRGDAVRLQGLPWRAGAPQAPYLFNGQRWMRWKGLDGGLRVTDAAGGVQVLRAASGWSGAVGRFRLAREQVVVDRLGVARASMLLAILTGTRSAVSPQQRLAVDRAGLSHLLAISGLHLVTVGAAVLALLLAVGGEDGRWGQWGAPLVSLAVVGLYASVTGWPVSAQRAFVMLAIWWAAQGVRRRGSLGVALGAAVLVVLLGQSTASLYDPGLQLSVTAVVGIALGVEEVQGPWWQRWSASMVQVTASCSAACAPWLAWHFGRLPVLGLVLNVVAIPLVQFGALGLGLVGMLWPGQGLGWALEGAACSVEAVDWMAQRVPFEGMVLGVASPWALWAALCMAVAVGLGRDGGGRRALVWVLAGTVAASAVWGGGGAEVRFFPVGQGDAILVRDGDGAAILVDAGGSMGGGVDPGRRVIVPGLARLGVRRLDVVMVSHADADHIAGMAEVILATSPREVWWQAPEDGGELGRAVLKAARTVGAQVVAPPARWRLGGLVGRRLDRSMSASVAQGVSRNERSVVMEVEVEGVRLLLTGDIEAGAEWRLEPVLRPVHVLKVAHHGSKTSSSQGFLRRTAPGVSVIQAGVGNRFGHPHAQVVERLGDSGSKIVDTTWCGEFVLRPVGGRLMGWCTHRY